MVYTVYIEHVRSDSIGCIEKLYRLMTTTITRCKSVRGAMMVCVEITIFAHYKQMRQALAKRRKQAVESHIPMEGFRLFDKET